MLPFHGKYPKLDPKSCVMPGAELAGDVELKEYASIWQNCALRGDVNKIVVGRYSNVQDNSVLHVDDDRACILGDYVTIGHGAIVHASTIEDNVLVGIGAQAYAQKQGFERKNMLTDRAKIHYHNRIKDLQTESLVPYAGHDTVGMVSLDTTGKMVAGTSTSGLFMKKRGRVGDSPFIGSGLYVDSTVGGATATGLGEDLMKGIISYEIVRLMEQGMHPQQACEIAVKNLSRKLIQRRGNAGDLSVVAMNHKGEWGAATNIANFSFVVATEKEALTVYRVHPQEDGTMLHEKATQEWLDEYLRERMKPLEVK